MIKISVITITCRTAPRLAEMAKTLAASLARTHDVELEWIIVDELQRTMDALTKGSEWRALLGTQANRMNAISIPPLESPHRQGDEKAPAHNSARNAGLEYATGDYVVLLNDCNVVTMDWIAVARDCYKEGFGWKCKTHLVADMKLPENGLVRMKDHHDRLRPVPPMTVAGACFGAPMSAFRAIQGFDLAYDGQRKGNDVDAVLRMARTGLVFIGTERAFTIQMRRTKHANEISTIKDAYAGARNLALLEDLKRDAKRTLPRGAVLPLHVPAVTVVSPSAGVLLRRTGPAGSTGRGRVATAPAARAPRPADDAPQVNSRIEHEEIVVSDPDAERILDLLNEQPGPTPAMTAEGHLARARQALDDSRKLTNGAGAIPPLEGEEVLGDGIDDEYGGL